MVEGMEPGRQKEIGKGGDERGRRGGMRRERNREGGLCT